MAGELEAGFAKLQGEDFVYYMQTYSIVLGRNSKKSSVDVDLAGLGGGMNISRQHARIYYDFDRKRFALEVLGKNGCHVQGTLYHPGCPHVKLDSQYLLQIGDKKFYFLLPVRSILKQPSSSNNPTPLHHSPFTSPPVPAHNPLLMPAVTPAPISLHLPLHLPPPAPSSTSSRKRSLPKSSPASTSVAAIAPLIIKTEDIFPLAQPSKKARGPRKHESMDMKPSSWLSHDPASAFILPVSHARQGVMFHTEPKMEARRPPDTGAEASPMQAEEKEVVSAVATVLSDLCGPGEWMALPNLHSELVDQYSSIWPTVRVRKFLIADDIDGDSKGRPWAGLLALLRKFPEHFVINTRTKGRTTSEFVSLVSLLS